MKENPILSINRLHFEIDCRLISAEFRYQEIAAIVRYYIHPPFIKAKRQRSKLAFVNSLLPFSNKIAKNCDILQLEVLGLQ